VITEKVNDHELRPC